MAHTRRRACRVAFLVICALTFSTGVAGAHSGGLDSNGGHYCREAGYESGACSPLNSYHCHDSGCVDYDGATGNGGGGGETSDQEPERDVYRAAPSGVTGRKMTARRMLSRVDNGRERRGGSYSRARFPHWADVNGDGCDTRAAVLIEESRIHASWTAGCSVTSGRWVSMYDGTRWSAASDVDVDHVVALKEAWVSGAYSWSRKARRGFANDLRFRPALRAVTDNVNASKGDRDPAEWLPAKARCTYAINWVQVKYRWRLKTSGAERRVLASILSGDCGSRRVAIPYRAR